MNNRKKVLVLSLIFVFLLSLAACSTAQKPAPIFPDNQATENDKNDQNSTGGQMSGTEKAELAKKIETELKQLDGVDQVSVLVDYRHVFGDTLEDNPVGYTANNPGPSPNNAPAANSDGINNLYGGAVDTAMDERIVNNNTASDNNKANSSSNSISGEDLVVLVGLKLKNDTVEENALQDNIRNKVMQMDNRISAVYLNTDEGIGDKVKEASRAVGDGVSDAYHTAVRDVARLFHR